MASSSSSSKAICDFSPDYEVFLSFRGEDTRHSFTSHLYASIVQNDIRAFIDDEGLERGDEISQALKDAIERSKISVIVLSEDYASSSWCLDELVHILQCRKRNNQIVLPVFYHVDPSDVRKQKGNYEASFINHEERFRGESGKVNIWRDALKEAANLSGWDSQVIRSESELVKKVVEDILKKLNRFHVEDDFTGFVGLERRFEKIEELLLVDSPEALITIGIWGTGGIGKTTLARIVFQHLYSKFEACCFIEDIRVDWEQGRKKYYDSKNTLFDHNRLQGKRVLLVLDNVNDLEQLEILAGDANRFGMGSRIIVTSRDMQILRGAVDVTYRVEKLDFEEAYQLFCSTALRKTRIENGFSRELCELVINYAEGIPLALKVLSSILRGKKQENWEAEINKLKECPNINILNILKKSYEELDDMQKCIFLDVACFFQNVFRADAERILEACGLYPKTGLDDLVDKSLISVNVDDKLCIHDLIQQMAFAVVKSEQELKNRSRLWNSQDACHILETNRGSTSIEGIFLDMSTISQLEFDSAAFQSMYKLRLLKIFHSDVHKTCDVSIKGDSCDLQFFSSSLRYLHWEGFPWKSFPSSFRPQYLVEINLPFSNVVQLWKGTQPLGNLMKIDVSFSKNLIELPDLSKASKLEHVYLEQCTSLREVPSSLEILSKLKTLNLNGCSSVRKFPNVPKNIVCLVLSGTAIKLVPQLIQNLDLLEILNLSGCQNLRSLPSFSTMKSLKAVALPETRTSRKNSWFFFQNNDPELETCHVIQNSVSYHITFQIRKHFPLNSELQGHWYDFGGHTNSVAIASISRTVLTKKLAALFGRQARNLMFYNWLEVNGERISCIAEFHKHHLLDPVETNMGFGCLRDKIPDWFDHQCTGDTLHMDFQTIQQNHDIILGFAVCAVVDINDNGHKRSHTVRRLNKDGYKEFNLFCEMTNPVEFDSNYDFKKSSFRFWGRHDEDINSGAKVINCGVRVIYRRGYPWREESVLRLTPFCVGPKSVQWCDDDEDEDEDDIVDDQLL